MSARASKVTKLPTSIAGKKYTDVRTESIRLTPRLAYDLLKTIDERVGIDMKQRSVNERAVKSYAKQMRDGEWTMNGEPIILSSNGYLMDGQHRCWAVIESNTTIPVLMTVGVKESVMDTIDQNRVRSHADVLSMAGYSKALANILATSGRMEMSMRLTGSPETGRSGLHAITPKKVRLLVEDTPELVRSAEWVHAMKMKAFKFPKNRLGWLHYRFHQIDPQFSDGWLEDLISGANLGTSDPRLWIRTRIAREMSSNTRTKENHKMVWIIGAWDRSRNNKRPRNENSFLNRLTGLSEYRKILLKGDKGFGE